MNIEKIREKLNNLVVGIAQNAIDTGGLVPKFWQLYLGADQRFSKVDTCATSHCLSILANAHYTDENLISNAVASVVRLRNEEGSWPSAITTSELAHPDTRMKGDTAIGDNCFALTALIDAGFLNANFCYASQLSNDFESLYYRIKYVLKAVDWLLNNKATDNLGWYYTDNKEIPHSSVMLTTLNVLQVFSKIIFWLNVSSTNNKLDPNQKNECILYRDQIVAELQRIVEHIVDSNNIFEDIQYEWKAIGTSIKIDAPSIIHTCKLVNLILYNKKFNNLELFSEVQDLARYVIDKSKSQQIFEASCKDFYFEYYDLNKLNDLGLYASPIQVDHENFAEGIALSTLIDLQACGYVVKEETINTILNLLLDRMSRTIPNFFRCRSEREKERNLWYPVYASYEAYMALKSYVDNYNIIYPIMHNQDALTIAEAINFQNTLIAQISRLQTYKTDPDHIANPNIYGPSIEDCGPLIGKLEAILEILSDSNYKEQETIYNNTLLQKIRRIL